MGSGASSLNATDIVVRLRLTEAITDEQTISFLQASSSNLISQDEHQNYYVSPAIMQEESTLFWFIRMMYRDTRRTVAAIHALQHSKGEDVGLFSIDYQETVESHAPAAIPSDMPYVLNAECAELHSLTSIVPLISELCIVVNLTNNHIVDREIFEFAPHIMPSNIAVLHLGGNKLASLSTFVPALPINLLVLDLSFSEGLEFKIDCFRSCFQLKRLVLDGCGLSTTTILDDNQSSKSIFEHLYCLSELSLKENNFETVSDLKGLELFGFSHVPALDPAISELTFGCIEPAATLKHLWLAENPLCDIRAVYTEVISILQQRIISLTFIDDQQVGNSSRKHHKFVVGAPNSMSRSHSDGSGSVFGSTANMDAADKEFVTALRGEKDISIVA